MSEEINVAKQWAQKAKNDLLNADNNLQSQQIPTDTVCFHCQQAAEKLLKAFLTAHNHVPPHTHDLLLLLSKILPIKPEAENLRDPLAILIPFAVEIRYPDDGFMPSIDDAKEAREAASRIVEWISSNLPAVLQ